MHFFFLFSAPSKWNVFFRITEIGAHKLWLHAPFTMDIIKGRLLFDAFSDVFMSCICFADTVNICGNKHIFIVIVIVIVSTARKSDIDIQSGKVCAHMFPVFFLLLAFLNATAVSKSYITLHIISSISTWNSGHSSGLGQFLGYWCPGSFHVKVTNRKDTGK